VQHWFPREKTVPKLAKLIPSEPTTYQGAFGRVHPREASKEKAFAQTYTVTVSVTPDVKLENENRINRRPSKARTNATICSVRCFWLPHHLIFVVTFGWMVVIFCPHLIT
jgi:hypothetical protein